VTVVAPEAFWEQDHYERRRHDREIHALQRRLEQVTAVHDATMHRLAVGAALKVARPLGPVISYARSRLQRP
jgi:hypothetical protein